MSQRSKTCKKLNEANTRCFTITIFSVVQVSGDLLTRSSVKNKGKRGEKKDKRWAAGESERQTKDFGYAIFVEKNDLRDFARKSHIFLLYKYVHFCYYVMLSPH